MAYLSLPESRWLYAAVARRGGARCVVPNVSVGYSPLGAAYLASHPFLAAPFDILKGDDLSSHNGNIHEGTPS